MDGDDLKLVEEFVSGPLVAWVQAIGSLADSRADPPASPQEKQNHESPREYFLQLLSGDVLVRIMGMIDMVSGGRRFSWSEKSVESYRFQTLQAILQRLHNFYQNDLQQLILSSPPNIYLLAHDPFTAQAVGEMKKLLLLLLGSAVQCERRDEVIGRIQTLDITTQTALVSAIQEVTREPENTLRLNWRDLTPAETEQLLRDVIPRIRDLVHERDEVLEKLWELQQAHRRQPDARPESQWQHLGVQLAEAWAQVRRLRQELEEKGEEILDQQEERKEILAQVQKLKQENRALAGEARLTGLYRDEVDALREKASRAERLQAQLVALKERLPALEECRAQLKDEQEFSQALLETKAMLEGQLETARSRGQRLNQLEKETRRLQSSLNQAEEERDHLHQQVEELLREKLFLERQLKQNLEGDPDILRTEGTEREWVPEEPSDAPILLNYEMKEAGRLLVLERENQELRRKLQEAFESRDWDPEPRSTLPNSESQAAAEPRGQASGLAVVAKVTGPRSPEGLVADQGENQKPEVEVVMGLRDCGQPEVLIPRREAEQHRGAESHLEARLRTLQEAHAATLETRDRDHEQWRSETERLMEEIQALEREQETLRSGSRALQAAAAQAELELEEAHRSLQQERLEKARLAQTAQQAEEDRREAQKELDALQRSREQHMVAMAQLGAEKAALEEVASEAESCRRQLEKENRRLKAQVQVQEEALAAQGGRLARLEAQNQQQAQRLQDLDQEVAGLRERLNAEGEASARLEEELRRERAKGKERETASAQLRETTLAKGTSQREEAENEDQRKDKQGGPVDGKKTGVEDKDGALMRKLEELQSFGAQLANNPNAALQAEKLTLTEQLRRLESQVDSLHAALRGSGGGVNEGSGNWQAQNSRLEVEAALLRSQQAVLESHLSESRQRLSAAESDVQGAQREREEWRGRYGALLRDHERLVVLHERQGADLERLLEKHASLKGAFRNLEQEYRELQSRHSQFLGQKTSLDQKEDAVREQKKRLDEAELRHRELAEQHRNLKEEHERVKQTLLQTERARDDLQGELQGMRHRVTSLQLEQARREAESATLKEQNQQLDTALGRLTTQCELLAQLKGNQEEENRHLLQEIQALSRENRRLLEHSMESREHFQEEQRQYLDKLGELRREKQKLVEKIMDQYRVLEPALPRGKKSSWIAEKLRKLMKPRREALRDPLRPMAEGAGSSESLTGPEGHGADGSGSSTPSSPAPLRKTSSTLTVWEAQQAHLHRHRLSSRLLAVSSPGAGDGEGQDTPRQRFRQRRLGWLAGSCEEVTAVEWEVPREEKRGSPLGEEEKNPTCPL